MAQVKSRRGVSPPLTRPVGGNRVSSVFTDEAALKGILGDLGKAERKIQFESFLFSGDHGQAIADALIARHDEGVQVQVLLDGKAQMLDRERLVTKLRAAGVDVRYFDPRSMPGPYAVDHSKLLVIDDQLVWVGGVNFDAEINRDMMTRIEGPAVRRLQGTFEEGWTNAGGKLLPAAGAIQSKGDVWVGVSQTGPRERSTRDQVLSELARVNRGDAVDIWMMDLADAEVLDALEAAQSRGVKIRALIDLKVPFASGRSADTLAKAIAGGIPDLPGIRRLQDRGIEVRAYVPPAGIAKLHAKVWLFTKDAGQPHESRRVIGGTVNAIKGAYEFNHEVGVLFFGKGVGADVQAAFREDFTRHSEPIKPLRAWERLKSNVIELLTNTLI